MAMVKIPEEFKNKLEDAFFHLEDVEYRLTKICSKKFSMVPVGYSEHGRLTILNRFGEPSVCVRGNGLDNVLSTSPVIGVVNSSSDHIEFETDGGVYLLQRIEEEKKEKTQ